MSSPDVRSVFFTNNTAPILPSAPDPSLSRPAPAPTTKLGKAKQWLGQGFTGVKNGAASVGGKVVNFALGTVDVVKGSKDLFLKPEKSKALKEFVQNALLSQASEQVVILKNLLRIAKDFPEELTKKEIDGIVEHFNILSEGTQTLQTLGLNEDAIGYLSTVGSVFSRAADILGKQGSALASFQGHLRKRDAQDNLEAAVLILNELEITQQGALVNAVLYLQRALLNNDDGLVKRILDAFSNGITDKDNGVLKRILNELQKEDGLIDQFSQGLKKKEKEILEYSCDLFREKVLGQKGPTDKGLIDNIKAKIFEDKGLIDQLIHKFTNDKDGFIVQARLKLAEQGKLLLNELAEDAVKEGGAVDKFTTKLTAKDGLIEKGGAKIGTEARKVLDDLSENINKKDGHIDKLKKKLFEQDGLFEKLRETFIGKDKEGFVNTMLDQLRYEFVKKRGHFKKLHDAFNARKEVIDAFQKEMTEDNGMLDRIREKLMQDRSTDPKALIENCIQGLNDELNAFMPKNPKGENQQFFYSLWSAFVDVDGIFDSLKTKLSSEKGMLDALVNRMLLEIAKKDGLIDGINDKLNENDGLIDNLTQKIAGENGLVDKMVNRLTEKVTEKMKPLQQMLEPILGPSKTDADSQTDAPQESATGWLGSMREKITGILSKGVQAVSHESMIAFASVLAYGVQQIYDKIKEHPQCAAQRDSLSEVLKKIEGLKNPEKLTENLQTLKQTLSKLADDLDSMKIYINGFRFPQLNKSKASEESSKYNNLYYKNIDTLRAVNSTQRDLESSENWLSRAAAEKEKFIDNVADLGTLAYFYMKVADKGQNFDYYLTLMDKAKTQNKALIDLVLEDFQQKGVSRLARFRTWLSFNFFHDQLRAFIGRASNAYFDEISQYIQTQKQKEYRPITEMLTTNSTRYLGILNDAFKYLLPVRTSGLVEEMLKKEMDLPVRNQGYKVENIFNTFIDNILKKGSGNSIRYFFVKYILGSQASNMQLLLDNAISSLKDMHGYPHALNNLTYDLLDELWKKLRNPTSQSGESQNDPSQLFSKTKRRELTTLVKNLFDVLRKSKCQTFEELEALLQGKNFKANVSKAIDDLFINDVIERISVIVGVALNSAIKEEQLQKLTFSLLGSLNNNVFNIHKVQALAEEESEKESQVQGMIENILEFLISSGVDQAFNSSDQEQVQVNKAINTLRTQSEGFIQQTQQQLTQLSALDYTKADDQLAACIKATTLTTEAQNFQMQAAKGKNLVKTSKWNEDNRKELFSRHAAIDGQTAAFVQDVSALKIYIDALKNHTKIFEHLNRILDALNTLGDLERGMISDQNLKSYVTQLESIKIELRTLINLAPRPDAHEKIQKIDELSQILSGLNTRADNLSKTLQEMQKAQRAKDFALNLLSTSQLTSPLAQYLHAKQTNSSSCVSQCEALKQQMMLSLPEKNIEPAIRILEQLHTATSGSAEENVCKREFAAILQNVMEQSNAQLREKMQTCSGWTQEMRIAIDGSNILTVQFVPNKIQQINTVMQHTTAELEAFKGQYKDVLKEISYANFTPIDMSEFKKWAKDAAHKRAMERADGLFQFISRRDTCYSMLNHMVLIPNNEYEKSKKKGWWEQKVDGAVEFLEGYSD